MIADSSAGSRDLQQAIRIIEASMYKYGVRRIHPRHADLGDPPMVIAMEPWSVRQSAAGATEWPVTDISQWPPQGTLSH